MDDESGENDRQTCRQTAIDINNTQKSDGVMGDEVGETDKADCRFSVAVTRWTQST